MNDLSEDRQRLLSGNNDLRPTVQVNGVEKLNQKSFVPITRLFVETVMKPTRGGVHEK